MADSEFFLLAYAHLGELISYSLLGCAVLFVLSGARLRSLFTDPFHFYYTFTFGTSYGVVFLLQRHGLLSPLAIFIVFGYGAMFLVAYRMARVSRFNLFVSLVTAIAPAPRAEKRFVRIAIAVNLAIATIFVYQVGFGFLQESRFEGARGLGSLSRVLDALRLFAVSWLAITVARRSKAGQSWVLMAVGTVALALLGALVNGAKFAMLEMVYAAIVAISASNVGFRLSRLAIVGLSGVAGAVAVAFAVLVLTFNLSASGVDTASAGQYLDGSNIVLEMAANRVMGNADMYYLSLPNDVIDHIETGNPILLGLAPIAGSGTLSSILGYDINNLDIGRAIWLYWYPGDPVMRGPTNHFDLTGFRDFGLVGGLVFATWIGVLLGQFEKLKHRRGWSDGQAALATAFWLAALIMLLHPALGFARLLDLVIVLGLVKIASLPWQSAASGVAAPPMVEHG